MLIPAEVARPRLRKSESAGGMRRPLRIQQSRRGKGPPRVTPTPSCAAERRIGASSTASQHAVDVLIVYLPRLGRWKARGAGGYCRVARSDALLVDDVARGLTDPDMRVDASGSWEQGRRSHRARRSTDPWELRAGVAVRRRATMRRDGSPRLAPSTRLRSVTPESPTMSRTRSMKTSSGRSLAATRSQYPRHLARRRRRGKGDPEGGLVDPEGGCRLWICLSPYRRYWL